jgi:hypothetical protein
MLTPGTTRTCFEAVMDWRVHTPEIYFRNPMYRAQQISRPLPIHWVQLKIAPTKANPPKGGDAKPRA